MRAVDLIAKKRDGHDLTPEEISWFIESYTSGDLPDYQAAAFLMAVYLKGMSREETVNLTLAMARSGDVLDLSSIIGYSVDKHSSGGVGDKTTLIVLPLVASFGVPSAKMSGRGLGFSGGTLDKLESIAGFNVNLSMDEFQSLARKNGIVLAGQSADLAPADGKLYALRDVTATVPSLPLIASSIMSKKIAAGANGIVLDVKVGRGAFMTNLDNARALAQIMVDIGVDAGRDMIAVLSDMNQPLGFAVGNALEVIEAVECLNGEGPDDLREHCLEVSAYMLRLAGRGEKWTDADEVRQLLIEHLDGGKGLAVLRQMVEAQGGDVKMIDDPNLLPKARFVEEFTAQRGGYIAEIAADEIGIASSELGAGRERKTDTVDLAVGLWVGIKVGDFVEEGTPLVKIHANDQSKIAPCRARLERAITYSDSPVERLPLFYGTIYGNE